MRSSKNRPLSRRRNTWKSGFSLSRVVSRLRNRRILEIDGSRSPCHPKRSREPPRTRSDFPSNSRVITYIGNSIGITRYTVTRRRLRFSSLGESGFRRRCHFFYSPGDLARVVNTSLSARLTCKFNGRVNSFRETIFCRDTELAWHRALKKKRYYRNAANPPVLYRSPRNGFLPFVEDGFRLVTIFFFTIFSRAIDVEGAQNFILRFKRSFDNV